MSSNLPPQAKFWGFGHKELVVLRTVAHYFNGKSLPIHGEERKLGTHHDLPLQDMFEGTNAEYEEFKEAHIDLLDRDLLEEKYVARRKIDWAPTERGRKAIRDVFAQHAQGLNPHADQDETNPLYGDPNAGIVHRKGVEIAKDLIQEIPWTTDHRGVAYGIEYYPTQENGNSCHDIHVKTDDYWLDDLGVEVMTDNNNMDYFVRKWKRFRNEDRVNVWILDQRKTACRLWNQLDKRNLIHLDNGQFRKYGNWSLQPLNRKVWRSEYNYKGSSSGDLIYTVTGLLEGGEAALEARIRDYHSYI